MKSSILALSVFMAGCAIAVAPALAESKPPQSTLTVINNFDEPSNADTDDVADTDEADADDQGADNDDQGADNDDQGADNNDQGGDNDDQGGDQGDQGE